MSLFITQKTVLPENSDKTALFTMPLPSLSRTSAGRFRSGVKAVLQAVIALLTAAFAFILCYYSFGHDGYGNPYYSAALRSMAQNWHNFFFVSFDPAGFISVDKPPVALWIEALFVKFLGFSNAVLLLPGALAAAGSVLLLYRLVQRRFGFAAGIISAAVLAVTPIFVATSRSNNPDTIFAFVLLLAAWASLRAAETGRLRWFLLTSVFIGIAFNTKTLVACLIVPACALVCLFAKLPVKRKAAFCAVSTALCLAVSFAWITAVDMTPSSARPFVGSSKYNSELDLTFGYNGFNRVFAKNKVTHNETGKTETVKKDSAPKTKSDLEAPGMARLVKPPYDDQIGWFMALALVGGCAAAVYLACLSAEERRRKLPSLLLWGAWAVVMTVFFSFYRELTHRYYLNIIAPGLAALCGIGVSCMVKLAVKKAKLWHLIFLPAAFILSVALQLRIMSAYPAWRSLLLSVERLCVLLTVLAVLAAILRKKGRSSLFVSLTSAAALLCLLVAPLIWSLMSVVGMVAGPDAAAGPTALDGDNASTRPSLTSMWENLSHDDTSSPPPSPGEHDLEIYLSAHRQGAAYLAATPSTFGAEDMIIDTGKAVMAVGGYNGENPVLTFAQFQNLVEDGKVRYYWDASIGVTTGKGPDRVHMIETKHITSIIKRKIAAQKSASGTAAKHRKISYTTALGADTNAQIIDWVRKVSAVVPRKDYAGSDIGAPGTLYRLPAKTAS